MALFDDLIGGVVSAVAGDKAPALNDFLHANGGVSGLAEKFQNGGAQVQQLAQKLGVDPQQASGLIAQALPQLIDRLTPNGTIEPAAASAS
jgi:uncharacterized protein YidB (DUF937 family)